MERPLVIHGSFMGGYGLPGTLALVGVLGGIAAVLSRIWARPAALTLWLILMGVVVATIFIAEATSRRNVVEVSGDRIRWSFRQPPDHGDEPLPNLQRVDVFPSAVRLVFEDDFVVASRADFRRRDINRLVEALRQLGAQVSGSGPTW
jgi:hypothetical protein